MKVPQRRPAAEPRWGLVEVAEAPMACRLGTIEWARHWKWKRTYLLTVAAMNSDDELTLLDCRIQH